nr:ABC transporter ATP-binding protein [Bifidobacterium sp. DSM 109957]
MLLFIIDKILVMLLPIMAGMIVDQVIEAGMTERLAPLAWGMVGVTLVRTAARYGYQVLMERFGLDALVRIVCDEYEKLHTLDFTYFNHVRNGDIMNRMTADADGIRNFVGWTDYQMLDCICLFFGSLVVMFGIDWRLTLALAVVSPFIFVVARAMSKRARPLFFGIRQSLAGLNAMVEENIEGNRVVKAFAREPYETQKFDEHNQDFMQANMKQARNTRRFMPWLDGLSYSLQLITLVFGGLLVIDGQMTLGTLVSFNSFLWMLDGPTRQFGWLLNEYQRFNASCVKVRRLLAATSRLDLDAKDALRVDKETVAQQQNSAASGEAVQQTNATVAAPVETVKPVSTAASKLTKLANLAKPSTAATAAAAVPGPDEGDSMADAGAIDLSTAERIKPAKPVKRELANRHMAGEVVFDHVGFTFPDDPDTPILDDVSFKAPAGSSVGILGETGSGKSTMVSLIARFYDPTHGKVLIDGVDAREWPLDTLRKQVCVVMQDTFLFSDTIRENIAFGASQNDDCYIRQMARIAGADEFITAMPDGYDTVVGERGVGLSGGQKQRLSLARALADNPSILIMDDTTSAVDMETEAAIQRHLKELDGTRTIFTIAHRISSVKDADQILVIDHGRIVERGTHDELVAAHGRYWEIYRKQLGAQTADTGYDNRSDRDEQTGKED